MASTAEADYEPNLQPVRQQKCDFILAVGGLMADATEKVAGANPNQQFAHRGRQVDGAERLPDAVRHRPGRFLAGYLAAGYSKSGKVATYGGLKIPPVTIFMDGFADGVKYYNKVKSKNVQVLGWDKAKQDGMFTNDFVAPDKGKAHQRHVRRPGRGRRHAGRRRHRLGTGAAAKASAASSRVIWVDQDGCNSTAQYCQRLLTTVVKNITDAVRDARGRSRASHWRTQPGYHRHAGEQRCLPRAVPRVRQQDRPRT